MKFDICNELNWTELKQRKIIPKGCRALRINIEFFYTFQVQIRSILFQQISFIPICFKERKKESLGWRKASLEDLCSSYERDGWYEGCSCIIRDLLDSFHHGNSMHCKLFQESENQIIGKERKHKMNGINLESYLMIKSAKETKFRSKILTIQNDLIEWKDLQDLVEKRSRIHEGLVVSLKKKSNQIKSNQIKSNQIEIKNKKWKFNII
jgi:hypothetical protein